MFATETIRQLRFLSIPRNRSHPTLFPFTVPGKDVESYSRAFLEPIHTIHRATAHWHARRITRNTHKRLLRKVSFANSTKHANDTRDVILEKVYKVI